MGERPKALVITAPGINCDAELAQAFAAAGAEPELVLLERIRRTPGLIDRFALIGLPGGFSYGDDVAAGRVMAVLMRETVYPALAAAVERGTPMICPCNGFQIAVQAGLLPGADAGRWPDRAPAPTVALCPNRLARFRDVWTRVEVPADTRCIWTAGLTLDPEADRMPSAHGEGRFETDAATLARLERQGQVALRYDARDNFNGSMGAVAGICDPSGRVLGLMPHPERFTRWTQHPWWTRLGPESVRGEPLGLRMFRRAVDLVRTGQHHRSTVPA